MKEWKEGIVKVQISLFSSDNTANVLVYNKDQSVVFEGEVSKEVVKAMKGETKAFFYFTAMKGGYIRLFGKAPWQGW